GVSLLVFLNQKTAYDIGLGIAAEPLFRSTPLPTVNTTGYIDHSAFIGIRVNRAKKSGMVNIPSSVNSRERSGINTILHELNPLLTINVTMRDIKSKNVYSRVNSKATTQWRKTESANGVHLEGVASDNRSS